ncbi:fasciclin domain-containing protein [Pontibacter liquoris]|uniref:fasciclin domain-containing protein n=1 Tax=Pontibacter liquoris TaxID=2905677 RepID=UPI001FA6BCB7|nr:fasciclin domain-containing protein [Pontibacter liquoris]
MKNKLNLMLAAVAAACMLFGCASSNEKLDTVVSTGPATDRAEAPGDTGGLSPAPADSERVSADNPVGRGQNIFALLQSNPKLSTLVSLIHAADMITVLESPGDYTLFAPTNEAFAALPSGTLKSLMLPGNKPELTRILQSHVLPGRVMSYELKDNIPMKTAQGDSVAIEVNDRGIVVGGAQVLTPDVKASNGVIHVIDRVLLPPQE